MDLPNKSPSAAVPPEAPKKNIQPVVDGAVKAPRPITRRFLDAVFAESPKELGKRVWANNLVPQGKAAAEAALNAFIHGMFWGQGQAPVSNIVRGSVLRGGAQVYHNAQNVPSALNQAQQQIQRSSGNYQDVVVGTQLDAETILAQLYSVLNEYRVVSVGDLYEMARIETVPSDNAYGWYSMDGARICKVINGFQLELPRPVLI